MDLTTDAIDKILELAPTRRDTIHGLEYQDSGGFSPVPPPLAAAVQVHTLDGLVNLLEAGLDEFDPAKVLVHVLTWQSVQVAVRNADRYGRRHIFIEAAPLEGVSKVNFNNFCGQEEFIICLQSCFQKTGDLDYLLDLASHLDSTEKVVQEDTGVAQNVTLKRSMALRETAAVQSRVSLAPYRTFRDIEQPVSDFVFRVHDGGNCGLFEADGGTWKIKAINAIAAWLGNRLKTSEVAALATIPVIS